MLAQVAADIKAEILGEARVKTFEKPSLGVVREGAVNNPEGWSTRLGVSKGVIEVYARADLGFADAGRTGTFLGGVRVLLDLL